MNCAVNYGLVTKHYLSFSTCFNKDFPESPRWRRGRVFSATWMCFHVWEHITGRYVTLHIVQILQAGVMNFHLALPRQRTQPPRSPSVLRTFWFHSLSFFSSLQHHLSCYFWEDECDLVLWTSRSPTSLIHVFYPHFMSIHVGAGPFCLFVVKHHVCVHVWLIKFIIIIVKFNIKRSGSY